MILRRAVLLAAIVVLAASSGFCSDVLMGRYDPEQNSFTSEKLPLPIALNWEFTANKFSGNPAAPVVAGRTCYFACGEYVYAVDLDTGTLKWQYPSGRGLSGSVKGTPAVTNGRVYFGAGDMNLYCLDAQTGEFKWAYPTRGAIRCPPVISDGVIYVGADDNSLYAIDAETGDAIWTKPFTARDDIAVGVAISSGIVTLACMDGNVYGVSAITGKLRSQPFRLSQAPTNTSPVILENMAVVAVGNSMYGLAVRGNQLRWYANLPAEVAATPAIVGQDIYVPCRDKKLYKYNVSGRQPVMEWTEPADIGGIPKSSPTVAGDVVYVTGSKGVVSGFSTVDGSLKWRYIASPSTITTPGAGWSDASSSPVIANGCLLYLTDDGVLHCFTSGAPDSDAPIAYGAVPQKTWILSGSPPIKISCQVYDVGSGIDWSTVSMKVNGDPVSDPKIDAATFTITYITEVGEQGKPMKKLPDGVATVSIAAQDYKGNPLTYNWFFQVDNSLPPPKRIEKAEQKKTTKEPVRPQRSNPFPEGMPNPGGGTPPAPPPPPMDPGGPAF